MNILITGATGFIGSYLLKLLTFEKMQVYCVVRNTAKFQNLLAPLNSIHLIEGDLLDASTFSKMPKSIDVVIHLAALLGEWGTDHQKIIKTNIGITESLLDWFSWSNGKHFIFISTPGVQGFGFTSAKETAPYNPRGIYEQTKVWAEEKVIHFKPRPNWTILRPDFVYGPGDIRRVKLYRQIKNGRWLKIGSGKSILRPTYVKDVCRAILICLQNPKAYAQIFNIAGPELITTDQYFDTIAKVLGVKLPSFHVPVLPATIAAVITETFAKITKTKPIGTKSQVDFLTQDHGTDISKIKDMLNFQPRINLLRGMQETILWARTHNLL